MDIRKLSDPCNRGNQGFYSFDYGVPGTDVEPLMMIVSDVKTGFKS